MAQGLTGLRVVAFEGRRALEIAELIRRHGGIPLSAPCMREVALDNRNELAQYLADLEAGRIDTVILLTGVGLRTLMTQLKDDWPPRRFAAALRQAKLVARGPKPVAVLKELGISPDLVVREPNTWRELLAALDADLPVRGCRVALQEYGISNPELVRGLEERGAQLQRVIIYRWELPEDLAPLRAAIEAVRTRAADVVVFTSANQVYTLFDFAERERPGAAGELRAAMQKMLIASIGPVCSDALREHGLEVGLQPQHPKMGQLIFELSRHARSRLTQKRQTC